MKKCNYFSSLIVILLMVFGFSLSAQSYIGKNDAIRVVKTIIKDNSSQSSSSAIVNSSNEIVSKISLDRNAQVKNLKVEFGQTLLNELKGATSVADGIAKAKSMYEITYKSRGQWDVYQEVEAFYNKLLQR
jgi:hypothetical protein